MDNGQDPASAASDKREGVVSAIELVQPTMRQSGTFEALGIAGQRLYVRSYRLATEIQSDFGAPAYGSTFKSGDSSSQGSNILSTLSGPPAPRGSSTEVLANE